jgi:hypothetical protein
MSHADDDRARGRGRGRRRGRPSLIEQLRREAAVAIQASVEGQLVLHQGAEQPEPEVALVLHGHATANQIVAVPSELLRSITAGTLGVAQLHPLSKYVIDAAVAAAAPGVQLPSNVSAYCTRHWRSARTIGSSTSLHHEAALAGTSERFVRETVRRLGAAADLAEQANSSKLQAMHGSVWEGGKGASTRVMS